MKIFFQVIVAIFTGWLIMSVGNVIEKVMVGDTLLRDVVGITTNAIIFFISGFILNYLSNRMKN